jgi:hypothetical protein
VRKRTDLPSVSMPDIYKHPTIRCLPAPSNDVQTPNRRHQTDSPECERRFADVLADIVGHRARVGRQPLLRRPRRRLHADGPVLRPVRKRPDLPSVSMPDIYKHPTIRSLAAALTTTSRPLIRLTI